MELAAKALAIHPDSLPHGTVGKAYSQQLTATGGQYPTYTFAFGTGRSSAGAGLPAAGKISGKPTKEGSFTFTVSVNDPAFKTYTIVIAAAVVPTTQEPTPTPTPTPTPSSSVAPSSSQTAVPIAVTGANTVPLTRLALVALLAGLVLLFAGGLFGRRPGRHRR